MPDPAPLARARELAERIRAVIDNEDEPDINDVAELADIVLAHTVQRSALPGGDPPPPPPPG